MVIASLALVVSVATPVVGHLARRRRESTQWVVTGGGAGGSATDATELAISLRNVGGRPAFGVRVEGVACAAILGADRDHHDDDFQDPSRRRLALCEPEDGIVLRVAFSSHDWATAAVRISWRGHPTERVTTRTWPLQQFRDFDRLLESMGGVPSTRRR